MLERGARVVLIRPAPVPGYRGPRSFGLPEFDPFWEKVVETGVLVAMHASDSGYNRHVDEWAGDQRDAAVPAPAVPHAVVAGGRSRTPSPRSSATARSSRFPDLKVDVVENGSSWVLPCSRRSPTSTRRCRRASRGPGRGRSSGNVYISPFWEEDWAALADLVGVDQCCSGPTTPTPRASPTRPAT